MERFHFEVGQTAITAMCEEGYSQYVKDAVFESRDIISYKLAEDSFFGLTHQPISPVDGEHPLIRRMCEASVLAGVGPMASVAGAIADYCVNAAIAEGCKNILIDNGGDLCVFFEQEIVVGLNVGETGFPGIGLKIKPTGRKIGICSSSGKIGPSVSYGNSGICTVFSSNATLADACATAFGNKVGKCGWDEMSSAAEEIASIDGVDGCLAIGGGIMAVCGDVPELIGCNIPEERITRIKL